MLIDWIVDLLLEPALGLHKKSKIHACVQKRVTLKALASVSPGRGPHAGTPRGVEVFALKPWVQKWLRRLFATLKGLRVFGG